VLIIQARRFRTQERNRQDAMERLVRQVRQAAVKPKARRPTKPSRSSRENRLEIKRLRSRTKQRRSRVEPGAE
jgi:ribosome-associated protein